MPDASIFLRKRKDKLRGAARGQPGGPRPAPPNAGPSGPLSRPVSSAPSPAASGISALKSEPDAASTRSPQAGDPGVQVVKLFSAGVDPRLTRHNLIRLNTTRETPLPSLVTSGSPLYLNRKHPGPKEAPKFAYDDEGNLVGKLVYDEEGKPVLGADGQQVVERKAQADQTLIGGEVRKRGRKGVREVYSIDREIIRLRREEATPWVLETGQSSKLEPGQPTPSGYPEHWVGRMTQAGSLPSALLVPGGQGFQVVMLGRTYRFDPERPFKVLDSDAANKLFEHQSKHKIHDRWAQRAENAAGPSGGNNGPSTSSAGSNLMLPGGEMLDTKPKTEALNVVKQEQRAARFEERMRMAGNVAKTMRGGRPVGVSVKRERFDDDDRREGRRLTRGMEGGIDEELDYDVNEEFQDDDDVNTFYRDAEEEEEMKLQEEQQKREYRMANANVGDRPQIESDSDSDSLFGDKPTLTSDGKKLKKLMRARGSSPGLFPDSDDDSDSSDDEEAERQKEREKQKQKAAEAAAKAGAGNTVTPPGSAERPSRPQSRGPNGRGTSSPTGRRPNQPPPSGKAATAPPGAGASLIAQRATSRNASPRGSRGPSPLGRAASPENMRDLSPGVSSNGRPLSPGSGSRAGSREGSPALGNGPRGPRPPMLANSSRAGSPVPGVSGPATPTTASPAKRRASPSGQAGQPGREPSRKKKKSTSSTPQPEDLAPFPHMLTKDEILSWFKSQKDYSRVPMVSAIAAFKGRILQAGPKSDQNSQLFKHWVSQITEKGEGEKMLKIKAEYR